MKLKKEKRIESRKHHNAPVLIVKSESDSVFRARMTNFSSQGLCFESDAMLYPSEEVDIGIENSPYLDISDIYDCYRAKILWRRTLPVEEVYKYGYGLMLLSTSNQTVFGISSKSLWNK
jgi:hypothetical protein